VGEEGELYGVEARCVAAYGEGADHALTHTKTLRHRTSLPVTLRAAGQPAAGDGRVGGVHDDSGNRARRSQGRADSVDEPHEEALATVGGLDGAPQGLVEQAHRVIARDQAP